MEYISEIMHCCLNWELRNVLIWKKCDCLGEKIYFRVSYLKEVSRHIYSYSYSWGNFICIKS